MSSACGGGEGGNVFRISGGEGCLRYLNYHESCVLCGCVFDPCS